MIFFVLVLLMVIISTARVAPPNHFQNDYLSRDNTAAVKGIFVLLVFLSHSRGYFKPSGIYDEAYLAMQGHLGQMVVAMFFFYSGYGMMEQTKARGFGYVKSIFSRRLPQLLLNMDVAVLVYLFISLLRGIRHTLPFYLQAMIGWTSLGNSNWYIFAMLFLYIFCCLAFFPLRWRDDQFIRYGCVLLLTGLSIVFVYVMMKIGRPKYCYNTVILFSAGYWYSCFKKPLEKLLMNNDFMYSSAACAVLALYLYIYLRRNASIECYSIWACCFTALVVLFTMKISIGSTLLRWFGEHVFSIYMIQRVPMLLLSMLPVFTVHKYMFMIACLVATIPLAMLLEAVSSRISRLIWPQ